MRSRRGFTLIEVLIVMAMLSILAALVYPAYTDVTVDAERAVVRVMVRNIREKIQFHESIGDVDLLRDGDSDDVFRRWFPGGRLPTNPWTSSVLKIQTVHGPKDATEPNHKTFQINSHGEVSGHTAWYNMANGSFCVMVPDRGSEQEILELFRSINDLDGSSISNPGEPDLENGNGRGNGVGA